MFSSKINSFRTSSIRTLFHSNIPLVSKRFNHQINTNELRQYFEKEINEHKKKGALPTSFILNDLKYYENLSRIRSKSDRLSYLQSLMSILKIPPSFAIPYDSGGIHSGFLSPYRNLGQSDLVNMSAWNYLKAQRLNDILLLNCSNLSSRSLAQLILDMRSNFNLLNEPWWPKLIGVSDETHQEIIDILKTKHHLHGVHLLTWETSNKTINEKDLTLICANHGETIYELDSHTNYIVQIAGDQRQCCLGDVTDKNIQSYKNIVKLQSRTKSFNKSKRILTSDLFQILSSLKMKDLFYKKVCKTSDDENYNIKSKVRTGLISH